MQALNMPKRPTAIFLISAVAFVLATYAVVLGIDLIRPAPRFPHAQSGTQPFSMGLLNLALDAEGTDQNRAFGWGYVLAIADVAANLREFCRAPGASNGDIVIAVHGYLAEHKTRSNEPASDVVVEALAKTFPCR